MKTIFLGRNKGKTEQLLKIADKRNGVIVCSSNVEKRRLIDRAKFSNYEINDPISWDDFVNREYENNITCFHIDNVQLLLQRLTNISIATITVNNDED